MKRATSTPAGLNVKKITAYLKGQAKSRNAVRITCQSGSVYIITGYRASSTLRSSCVMCFAIPVPSLS